jgi:transcriptional regulator with XRE-family HTH domain
MNKAKVEFAQRLLAALERAGVPAKPTVIEREFNQRYWGKPITLHAARLWLRGETMPTHDRLLCLAQWLGVEPAILRYGEEVPKAIRARRKRWDEGIGYQEREIFELFLKLPVPQRKVAREVILALAKAEGVLPPRAST